MMRSIRSAWVRTAFVLAATAATLAPAGLAKTVSWEVKTLKTPGTWKIATPNGINERGEMAGLYVVDPATDNAHAVRWASADADAVPLPETPGAAFSYVNAMNASGRMGGVSSDHAVIWDRKGVITDLHDRVTGANWSTIQALGRRGDAAGIISLATSGAERAVYWPTRGPAVVLAVDDSVYLSTRATAMNDRGIVCGYGLALPNGAPYHAVYWPKGAAMVDLHARITEVMPSASASMAWRVLDNGQIVGIAWEPFVTTVTVMKSWVYDPRHKRLLLVDDGGFDSVTAWAAAGSNVLLGCADGTLFDLLNFSPTTRPALWRRTKVRSGTTWMLTADFPLPAGFAGGGFVASTRSGARIVGAATAADGTVVGIYVSKTKR